MKHLLGAMGTLLALGGSAVVAHAQTLTVQPREAATATQNPAAGEYTLDSVTGGLVVVPPQCVGATRCPLLVQLPGGGQPASVMTGWMQPVADKYGFMVLALSAGNYKAADVDAALKETFGRFAVDPEKIAIAGRCASGGAATTYGIKNLHVFNRIISVSGGVPVSGMDPENKTAEFLFDGEFGFAPRHFQAAQALRQDGHPVTVTMALRGHEHQGEDYFYVGYWLQESWKPAAERTKPSVVADPLPELTTDALAKLTTFWTNFFQEPDSIRLAGRRAHLHEVIVPVGEEKPSVWMTNMPALAAKYPSVAAKLKTAGLTAQQHDAYRVALVGAEILKRAKGAAGTVEETSVQAKNLAFMGEHPDELKALASAGMENSNLRGIGGCCTNPEQVDQMGPLGFWRTP